MEAVQQEHGICVGKGLMYRILRSHFNMSFRKIQRVNFLGNLDRPLVLRQHYAKRMLALLAEGKRLLCIDESWCSYLDFRRRKWAPRGTKNTLADKDLAQNINIICALDTQGHTYVALTRTNTNESVMVTYLNKLVAILTREDPGFRQSTVLVVDGASYHKSPGTRLTLKRLGISYIVAAPWGYDTMICEYWFSQFKSQ